MSETSEIPTEAPPTESSSETEDPTREAEHPADLSAEQQQFLESFDSQTEQAMADLNDAKAIAGDQLQKLRGKDLVKAGVKQTLYGSAVGGLSRGLGYLAGTMVGSGLGSAVGMAGDRYYNGRNELNPEFRSSVSNFEKGAEAMGQVGGAVWGIQRGDRMTEEGFTNMTKGAPELRVKTIDKLIGKFPLPILSEKFRLLAIVWNPSSVSGVRHIAQGFAQMGVDTVRDIRDHRTTPAATEPQNGG